MNLVIYIFFFCLCVVDLLSMTDLLVISRSILDGSFDLVLFIKCYSGVGDGRVSAEEWMLFGDFRVCSVELGGGVFGLSLPIIAVKHCRVSRRGRSMKELVARSSVIPSDVPFAVFLSFVDSCAPGSPTTQPSA